MKARFSGYCKAGGHPVKVGETLEKVNGAWVHPVCARLQERIAARTDHDYRACEEFDGEPHTAADHNRGAALVEKDRQDSASAQSDAVKGAEQ